jgi:Aminotransferase class-V
MTTQVVTNWKKEWFEIEDATYLNTAAHTVMPRVSIRAVEHALEAKKFPHRVDESVWFEAPVRIRKSLSKMIGAKPEEIAVTTGASAGAAVVAYGLEWKRGDEIITVQREFPLQYATWKPMEEREGVRLRVIAPRDRFITADDLIDALAPKTRIVNAAVAHRRCRGNRNRSGYSGFHPALCAIERSPAQRSTNRLGSAGVRSADFHSHGLSVWTCSSASFGKRRSLLGHS